MVVAHTALAVMVFFSTQSFEYLDDEEAVPIATDDPVHLSYLNIAPEKATVAVAWNTHREIDTDYFAIERSIDGSNFTLIDTIWAAGNSRTTKEYELVDKKPELGKAFYRIKQVKMNGSFSFSEPMTVTTTKFVKSQFKVTPTVDPGVFNIYAESYYKELNLLLFDEKGTLVFSESMSNNRGFIERPIDFGAVAGRGRYFAKLDAGEDTFVKEVIIR